MATDYPAILNPTEVFNVQRIALLRNDFVNLKHAMILERGADEIVAAGNVVRGGGSANPFYGYNLGGSYVPLPPDAPFYPTSPDNLFVANEQV
jgi:hypothetical protein